MASTFISLPLDAGSLGLVSSFSGREGAVTPQAGDYVASQIGFTPVGTISATQVQSLGLELDSDIQALNTSLGVVNASIVGVTVPQINIRYVSKSGSDSTGNGSIAKPFLTVEAAMNSITGALPTDRHVIVIASGIYTESATFKIKPNVALMGQGRPSVNMASVTGVPVEWNTSNVQNYQHMSNINFGSGITLTKPIGSVAGSNNELALFSCTVAGMTVTGSGGSTDQDRISIYSCDFRNGNVTISGVPSFSMGTRFSFFTSASAGADGSTTPHAHFLIGCFIVRAFVNGYSVMNTFGCNVGRYVFDNVNGILKPCAVSMPWATESANLIYNNGATAAQIQRQTYSNAVGYTASVLANWPSAPLTVREALDSLALNKGNFRSDGTVAMTGAIYMGGNRIVELGEPANSDEAATMGYADTKIPLTDKGVANGVATLDGAGKVPSSQLPSYVDDVLEYANLAAFPVSGDVSIIYVAIDNGKVYRWSGTGYVEIATNAVNSVFGRIGVVSAQSGDYNSDLVTEGSTNLYHTVDRARSAAVADVITDGVLDIAPSQNVVFDALALKLNLTGGTLSGSISATNFSGSSIGTNTGDVTLASVGAAPNANAASLSGQVLTLQPANSSFPGVLLAADWSTFNSKQTAGSYITALTGDATASGPGSAVLTLAAVNATVGTFGTASSVGTFTVNAKGLITAASDTPIQITESQVTNLVADLASKQATGNYITALTGEVSASGPGSATATLSNAAVIAKLLTGFVSGAGTVSASDSILSAIQKIDGNTATPNAANRTLSNLTSPTAINQDLLPDTTLTRYLGSNTKWWHSAYIGVVYSEAVVAPTSTLLLKTAANADVNATPTAGTFVESGDKTAGTGDSGPVFVRSGTSFGGVRGAVILDGSYISASGVRITDVATPTSPQDAATKAYVDAAVPTNTTAAEQNLGALTWTATTAPSGTINQKYRWNRVGTLVNFWSRIDASVAGLAVSAVDFALPGDMPAPSIFSSQPNSTVITYGDGNITTGGNIFLSGASDSKLYKDGAGAYRITIETTVSVAGTFAWANFSYLAA